MSSVEENIDKVDDTVVEFEIKQDWTDAEAQEAESMGWIPRDRSKKLPEGKKFVGPKEFMERNPLYTKMKTLESSIGQLTEHYQKASERDRKAAEEKYEAQITTLKAKKVEAMDEGDHQAVVDIDEAIRTTEKPVEEAPKGDPIFDKWVSSNDWYTKDNYLAVQADMVAEKYLDRGLRGKELLDTMTDHMKKAYPDQFKVERDRPSAVEGDTRGAPRKTNGALTEKDLTADERTIYKSFEALNAFPTDNDKQAYFKTALDSRE